MSEKELLKRIWQFAKRYKWYFLFSYIVLLMELVFNQLFPMALSTVINYAVYEADIQRFLNATLKYTVIFIGYVASGFFQLQLWQRVHNKYIYDIRIFCYNKVLYMKPHILTDIKTGDVIQTINNDTAELHHIIQRYAMRIVNAGIGTVISLIIVATMKFELALFMLLVIPTSAVISKKIESKMKVVAGDVRCLQGQYSSWIMEILRGMREIKLFVAEKNVLDLFIQKNKEIIKATTKQERIQLQAREFINGIYFGADIVFYIICAIFVASGDIKIGEFVAISSYFAMTGGNIKRVLYGNIDFQRRKACLERVFKLLDNEEENDRGLVELEINDGEIEFQNLSFSYEPENELLKNINIQIKPGEKIGVVGQSGVGKSTLVSLLLKFYEPQKGEIIIDGKSLSKCSYKSIRSSIGIVSQENIIFDSTIRDNVTLGTYVSDEKIWDVLSKVYLRDVVEKFPKGLDTLLGEKGVQLSGGQKQRLCIARLFLRNPKVVILDEATSALDQYSEEVVQNALNVLTEGKTTIIISHRYKPLLNTDKILLLHNGEQVGYSSYEKLLVENEHFADLYAKQMEVTM